MGRVSGILDGVAVASGVVANELRYDLGLLDEVLGNTTPDVDHPCLVRPLHDPCDLVHILDLINQDPTAIAQSHDHSYAPGAVS